VLLVVAICLGLALGACGGKPAGQDWGAPRVELEESARDFAARLSPAAQELKSWTGLASAICKSERYCAGQPSSALAVDRDGIQIAWGEMAETLRALRGMLPQLDANPSLLLEKFRWVPLPGGIKYTSYCEPTVKASRKRTPAQGHTEPLYRVPPGMDAYKASHGGRYFSRREIIEDRALEGRGLELAWADPVDVFYLQIQGSGRLVFGDGAETFVNYAGKNGYEYRSPRSIMTAKGLLERGDVLEQQAWLRAHPERQKEIFNENPSYVFFKFGTQGSIGTMGSAVEPWISLASDPRVIPLGAVVAFGVNVPGDGAESVPLRGIGLAQDTGGAIKGDRIDIFAGGSERGRRIACLLDASGPAWVLVKK
jgi:membrane-bound lytic murein transglycosylase A